MNVMRNVGEKLLFFARECEKIFGFGYKTG